MSHRISNFQEKSNKTLNLKDYSSIKAGPILKNCFFPKSTEEFSKIYQRLILDEEKPVILGSATNSLISLSFENQPFIITSLINEFSVKNNCIQVSSGYNLSSLISKANSEGFSQIEQLIGIPGTIGGALFSNSGSKDSNIGDFLEKVTIIDPSLKIIELTKKECCLSYRSSIFKNNNFVILSASFRYPQITTEKEKIKIKKQKLKILQLKKDSGLFDYPSLGSYFKNPSNYSAGYLLEEAKVKELKV
ncbi:MAG: FAD-binding protein, partial [Sphaerochaetaceae bacterium]|nr:FAD-binding protein [Sphaerochaetaceae bacterium]